MAFYTGGIRKGDYVRAAMGVVGTAVRCTVVQRQCVQPLCRMCVRPCSAPRRKATTNNNFAIHVSSPAGHRGVEECKISVS